MHAARRTVATIASVATVVAMAGLGSPATAVAAPAGSASPQWPGADRTGSVRLIGQVPLAVASELAGHPSVATLVGPHPADASMSLNFSLPLHDQAGLDALIAQQARTHTHLSHAEAAARFAPPVAQVTALKTWLTSHGYTITHLDPAGTSVAASAPTSVVESTLATKVDDFTRAGYDYHGVKVAAYPFFSNTLAPRLPARLGVVAVSGLTDVARFFTAAQLAQGAQKGARTVAKGGGPDATSVRTGVGYYPSDLTAMYDVAGHSVDATGQTLGFTLWGAGETQSAMTLFSTTTSSTPITVDPACTATGNSPTTPSSCTTATVAANHLVSILENGNTNGSADPVNEYSGNVETALDIEQAHGMASGAGMKYYLANCTGFVPTGSGLTETNCDGTDVGMEEAVEDAANDPTLHTVSNSWGYGGEAEFGAADPFRIASEASFALAAVAGTTFWFSTGDDGSYESGFPADSPYVVGVGGTALYSTGSLTPASTTVTRSTATAWESGGSWCSQVEARPAWQTGAAVTAKAPCPGRIVPDISAVASGSTPVLVVYTQTAVAGVGVPLASPVAGTSVAAPEMNGMAAMTQAFLAKQTYPGAKPSAGFEGPMFYQLGNSASSSSYFNDVDCGNTASPAAGPDGDAADAGWDPATGWGEIDWFHWATGYAIALGATGLTQPGSLDTHFAFGCAPTPTNAAIHAVSLGTPTVGYAAGEPASSPWPGLFLSSGAWGPSNTFLRTTDGGASWKPANADMESVACPTTTTCVEVGDGGSIRRTTDSGTTWTFVDDPFDKALTSIACPTATTCYAAGDRGAVLKSTDAGATFAFASTADGNPLRGLSCPTETTCYAVDGYAHVEKTTDGAATWTLQTTPVTTPGVDVPGSGGPNPFAGLYGISCTSATACIAVGGFPSTGTDSPIVVTTDGGANWVLKTSNSGAGNTLNGVTCTAGTCYAVGANGAIVRSTDAGLTWAAMTSGSTLQLTGITCTGATSCVATGQTGTIDVLSGTTWTATTAHADSDFLAAVTCTSTTSCLTVGQEGVTVAFDPTAVATSTKLQAGGGTSGLVSALSCADATHCVAVGAGGVIVRTADSGQTWTLPASGTTAALYGVSCVSLSCQAVGGSAFTPVLIGSRDGGATWTSETSDATAPLNAISCTTTTACVAVGNRGTIVTTTDGGATYTDATSGTQSGLNGVSCHRAIPVAPAGAAAATACYAVGTVGATSTSAAILKSADGGANWTAQTSNSPEALSAISCPNRFACFANGALGTVVTTTDGGTTWTQQGNPISGPTTALNPGPADITATYSASCSTLRCAIGTDSAGDLMTSPTVTVTVNTGGPSLSAPVLTGLAPTAPGVSYNPASEAAHVTGTLTCTTTATAASADGAYPITGCSGLSDPGHSVVYDIDASTYYVGKQPQSITFPVITSPTYGDAPLALAATATSGLPITYTAQGHCTVSPTGTLTLTSAGGCKVTANQPGNAGYQAATSVSQVFAIAKATPVLVVAAPGSPRTGRDTLTGKVTSPLAQPLTGQISLSNGKTHCTARINAGLAKCSQILGGGRRTITGTYLGNGNYTSVTATTTVTVARSKPRIGIVRHRITQGQPNYQVRAHVFGFKGFPATGSVTLSYAGRSCTATLVKAVGTCTLAIPNRPTQPLKVSYSGDVDYLAIVKNKQL